MPDENADENRALRAICLPEQKRAETRANKKLMLQLEALTAGATDSSLVESWQHGGFLLYELATQLMSGSNAAARAHSQIARAAILDRRLLTKEQLHAAVALLNQCGDVAPPVQEFNEATGVGVQVDVGQIDAALQQLFLDKADWIAAERYKVLTPLLKQVREDKVLRWADGKSVKERLDAKLLAVLGEKDERDAPAAKKKKEKLSGKNAATVATANEASGDNFFFSGDLGKLHKPGGNPQIDPALMREHLAATGGLVYTRFPPEPNGYLHIGHAKAININFGYAKAHGGRCYLRYDDTNPEAEEERYFTTIIDSVRWLGFEPWKITYSSDYFQRLYDLAVELVRRDGAYVCHCTGEQIYQQRGGDEKGPRTECVHRNRPIEESLREFDRMRRGEYKEGEAILRMKMDMQHPSPQFWDLVAYRVLFSHHYRTADQWCIYPTYDYTHCLCDSFENISHSLCTTEFQLSRESYYWLCDKVSVYKPVQWEYGRLNITNTVLSKRKLTKLVEGGIVRGWDDPRLYTLVALRRRGFPPAAINKFVRDCGVTTNNSTIDVRRLEFFVRNHLDDTAPRVAAVVTPLPLLLANVPPDFYTELEAPYMPRTKELQLGTHRIPFTNTLYIDHSDFRGGNDAEGVDPNFFRLRVGGTVNLLHVPHAIYCRSAVLDAAGAVVALDCLYLDPAMLTGDFATSVSVADLPKPRSHIQWVAHSVPTTQHPERISSPQEAELRLYSDLFLHSNPMDKVAVPGGWLSDINPESLLTCQSLLECGMAGPGADKDKKSSDSNAIELAEEQVVQFSRVGYFAVDRETALTSKQVTCKLPVLDSKRVVMKEVTVTRRAGWVLNRTVTLREDAKKAD